ncbi:class I SAM-dependent methyltransferase [Clostridium algidicarnis]|uniref:class I SAM-dependent methyltransferase n=1 Tax=Clostridium algidicarnis TaxID=37659 RepID=UPI000496D983|nr:class I SAM-dependent methyltransferase [Clostridium algidicarnis]
MSFYEELSNYYDTIFEKSDMTLKFLTENLKENYRAIDLACGSGTYAIELGKMNIEVLGIDLDESMINLSKDKSIGIEKVSFINSDMLNLKDISNMKYNSIFCIGNSLVHITDKNKIKTLFKDVYNMLDAGGEFIVQIINYDRIIKYDINELPIIKREDKGLEFARKYKHNEKKKIINFNSELTIKKDNEKISYKNSVELLPIMKEELEYMLLDSGFKNINFYGGFNKSSYTYDSYATVVRAIKD